MTCIVGIEGKNTVWLGGDSAATSSDGSQTLIADKKVFVNGDIAFGICGSPKIIDPLMFTKFTPQKRGENNREYVGTVLVPMIKQAFKDSGCSVEHPEHGEVFQGEVLFGVGGKLYRMQSNFQLITDSQGYASVGSGSDIALGSLHATKRDGNAKRRIMTALEASALANAGVRPPFAVVSVRKSWF
jgi:ATP-dependent protease HslVU (ClpYQ) peptidase subunit